MTVTSAISGCLTRISSSSWGQMFAPPWMIMSLERPEIVSLPAVSMKPRSPDRNQPSVVRLSLFLSGLR
ncbi:hypothetical protein ABH935_001447 [Catenulispora sp. GAS73]